MRTSPRPRSTWSLCSGQVNMILLVGVFTVAVGAVYYLGTRKIRRQPYFTATASIEQETTGSTSSEIASIPEQILSDSNLRQALQQLGRFREGGRETEIASNSLKRLRRDLKVSTSAGPASGWLGISISCRGGSAELAMRLANFLAMQYRQQFLAEQQAIARNRHAEAVAAADLAGGEVRKTQQQLDATITQHLYYQRPPASPEPPGPAESTLASESETSEPLHTRVNPEWLDLKTSLTQLEQQRAELLLTRTPLHPEVQKNDLEMDELKKQLASVERHLPDKKTVPSPKHTNTVANSLDRKESNPAVSYAVRTDLVQRMEDQRAALARAQHHHAQLARAEREAWQARFQLPQINVELARECVSTDHAFMAPSPRLVLLALAVGLAMTAGVGLVGTGAAGEAVFATATEVRAALGAPIVGTISLASSGSRRRALATVSWFLMAAGCVLIVLASSAILAVFHGRLAV